MLLPEFTQIYVSFLQFVKDQRLPTWAGFMESDLGYMNGWKKKDLRKKQIKVKETTQQETRKQFWKYMTYEFRVSDGDCMYQESMILRRKKDMDKTLQRWGKSKEKKKP